MDARHIPQSQTFSKLTFDPFRPKDKQISPSSEEESEEEDSVAFWENNYNPHINDDTKTSMEVEPQPDKGTDWVFLDFVPVELKVRLERIIPENYEKKLCSVIELDDDGFEAVFLLRLDNEEAFDQWLQEFQKKSQGRFRYGKQESPTNRILFKRIFTCIESSQGLDFLKNRVTGEKWYKSNCQTYLTAVRFNPSARYRGEDQWLQMYPTFVRLYWCHNHTLDDAKYLGFKELSIDVQKKFLEMFENGHTQRSAMREYLNNPALDLLGDPERTLSDNSIVPSYKSLSRLYKTRTLLGTQGWGPFLKKRKPRGGQKQLENQEIGEEMHEWSGQSNASTTTSKSQLDQGKSSCGLAATGNYPNTNQPLEATRSDVSLYRNSSYLGNNNTAVHYQTNIPVDGATRAPHHLNTGQTAIQQQMENLREEIRRLQEEKSNQQSEIETLRNHLANVSEQTSAVVKSSKERFAHRIGYYIKTGQLHANTNVDSIIDNILRDESNHVEELDVMQLVNFAMSAQEPRQFPQQTPQVASKKPDVNNSDVATPHAWNTQDVHAAVPNSKKNTPRLPSRPIEGSFPCGSCKESFNSRVALLWHTKRTHEREKPFECQLCSLKFTKEYLLNSHLSSHSNEKPFSCDVCSVKFKSKMTLSRHKMIHTGERPYKCTICADGFKRKYELGQHIKRQHGSADFEKLNFS